MDKSTTVRRRRSQRDYTIGFKLSVVEQVEKGHLTYKQAQQRYGIQGRSTVLVWLRKYGSLDWSPEHLQAMNTETPEQKIKRLEKELEDERTRNLILKEMMTDIDRQYGVGLRKKYFSRLPEGCKPKAK